ncbi:MAG: S1C family serine protease [Eggerthellaceae bacterium]|jgi:S1-C subfamily serine protease
MALDDQTQSPADYPEEGDIRPVIPQAEQSAAGASQDQAGKKKKHFWSRRHKDGKKKRPGLRAFLGGLAGAAVACVLVLGVTGNLTGNGTTGSDTVEIGSDTNTTIKVKGEDSTLAETVAEKDIDSVVCIYVYSNQGGLTSFDTSSEEETTDNASSLGSGVILSKNGYILTNYHVIEGASSLKVSVGGEMLDAEVIGTDESSDLAVIKVDATGLDPIEIGSSSDLKVGEWVMAIGSPYGMEQSVSTGIISATNRSSASLQTEDSSAVYTNMIQTDAAINPGNSGGALVDSDGKLIGINTSIASNSDSNSGVGFAIPVDYAINIAKQLIKGETPTHASLGVSMATVDSQTARRYNLSVKSGAYVNSVVSGSAADQAGIEEGDIITKVDDTKISSSSDLLIAVRSHNPGDKITIELNRNGETKTVEVTLGEDSDSTGSDSSSQ